jgi:calcineurin-like phosphoesterase family protein
MGVGISLLPTPIRYLGHANILKYCKRPFLSESERLELDTFDDHDAQRKLRISRESLDLHDTTIIDNINAVVGRYDILWHLGDFAFGGFERARRYRDRIHCQTIYLVWGNHDDASVRPLFEDCFFQGGGGSSSNPPRLLVVEGQRIFLNHYPMLSWEKSYKGAWMLHGHVHGNIRRNPITCAAYDQMLICDTGVDGPCYSSKDHTFKPWSMDELRKYMTLKTTTFTY